MHVRIRVYPEAQEEMVVKQNGYYEVYVYAPARDGLANSRVIDLLSKENEFAGKSLAIVSGHRTSSKIVEIREY